MRISTTAILTIFVPYGECKIVARDSIGSLSRLPLSLGSRDGAVVRALASHRCGPAGFDSRTQRHMWVEFVVGSRSCSEGFSPGSPVSSLHKNQRF